MKLIPSILIFVPISIAIVSFYLWSSFHTALYETSVNAQTNKTYSNIDFPLGWYDYIFLPQSTPAIVSEGMDLVLPYTEEKDDETIQAYLDSAQAANLKVLVELRRSLVISGNTKAIVEFIHKFKEHPAVYGWYLYDEPELNNLSASLMKGIYRAIKREDGSKPVLITFLATSFNKVDPYYSAADILAFDYYPCRHQKKEFEVFTGKGFQEVVAYNKSVSKGKAGFWYVVQGMGENAEGQPQFDLRLPTFREERYMVYTTIVSGINGMLFWMREFSQPKWIDSVLKPIVTELRGYLSAIGNGKLLSKTRVDSAEMEAALYKDPTNDGYLLIAIHHGMGKVTPRIKIFDMSVKSARILEEDRSIDLIDRVLQDTFSDYEVRIYRVS